MVDGIRAVEEAFWGVAPWIVLLAVGLFVVEWLIWRETWLAVQKRLTELEQDGHRSENGSTKGNRFAPLSPDQNLTESKKPKHGFDITRPK